MSLLTKRNAGGLATVGAALVAAIGLAAGPASALTSVVVTGGGNISGTATNPTLRDNRSGATIVCTSGNATGVVPTATYPGPAPVKVGTINTATWITCKMSSITFTVAAQALPWDIKVTGPTDSTGKTPGELTYVKATLSGTCNATVEGKATGYFQNGAAPALVLNGGTLTVTSASGLCLGLIATGDSVTYNATYVVTPTTLNVLAS
jgi:hypothetical protein